jgi:hypothetical protein
MYFWAAKREPGASRRIQAGFVFSKDKIAHAQRTIFSSPKGLFF